MDFLFLFLPLHLPNSWNLYIVFSGILPLFSEKKNLSCPSYCECYVTGLTLLWRHHFLSHFPVLAVSFLSSHFSGSRVGISVLIDTFRIFSLLLLLHPWLWISSQQIFPSLLSTNPRPPSIFQNCSSWFPISLSNDLFCNDLASHPTSRLYSLYYPNLNETGPGWHPQSRGLSMSRVSPFLDLLIA